MIRIIHFWFIFNQSKRPPISIPYSSYFGGGGGATFFGYYFFPLSAGFSACFGAYVDPELDPPPTAPKKSVTLLPLRALATALTNVALTLSPAALRTAFNESAVTSAPDPESTKAA